MTDVRVDDATQDDLDAITDRWVALVADQRSHGAHLLPAENRNEARDVISQYIHTANVAVARLETDDESGELSSPVVGFVMYHLESGLYDQDVTRGIIDNVYVDPEHRGCSVGSHLLDVAEADLRDDGADVIALSVMFQNDAARRLYEHRGYEPHRLMLEKPTESDTHSKDDR